MEHHLKTPLTNEDIMKLHAGDIVFISGLVFTARDEAHERLLHSKKEEIPFDLTGAVVYHCGPLMQKTDTVWRVVAAGPTTSGRMNSVTPALLENFEVRAIIGKGGMHSITENMRNRCVYLAYTGGAAAIAASRVRQVVDVFWLGLGMPEAVWVLECDRFGPLIVGIDAHGNDLFKEVRDKAEENYKTYVNSPY